MTTTFKTFTIVAIKEFGDFTGYYALVNKAGVRLFVGTSIEGCKDAADMFA
jgi:hypothetical protein